MDTPKPRLEETSAWPVPVWLICSTAAVAGITILWAYRRTAGSRKSRRIFKPEDLVLYKFGKSTTAPWMSPFSGKLETYLRLAKIPYETVCGRNMSSKGKLPWLSHNGAEIADSQFCIEYLNKTFKVDMNKDMSNADKAVARSMRKMAEDSLYWYMVLDRWQYQSDPNWLKDLGMTSSIIARFAKYRVSKMGHAQGLGRHGREELYEIAKGDVKAFSDQLGDKLYMFGDQPVEEDCAIFGQLGCIYYTLYGGSVATYIHDDLPNLVAYIDRMKALAYPDWDQCLWKPRS